MQKNEEIIIPQKVLDHRSQHEQTSSALWICHICSGGATRTTWGAPDLAGRSIALALPCLALRITLLR